MVIDSKGTIPGRPKKAPVSKPGLFMNLPRILLHEKFRAIPWNKN
jgi:hypothetical protein